MTDALQRWAAVTMEAPCRIELPGATAVAFTQGLDPEAGNQDAVACLDLGERGTVLVLADGAGGMPGGNQACALAVDAVVQAARDVDGVERPLQSAVLEAFDRASDAIRALGIGAASTLAVVTVEGRSLRSYHAGDSGVLVTGQRGRERLATIAHSPTGYAVEAGYMSEAQALVHDERHLVSNLLGTDDMRIEVGPRIELSHFDTVVLASDGVLDNLRSEEVSELARTGGLLDAAGRLREETLRRMEIPSAGRPGKPDDLSFVLYRPRPC